jgi:hypothetical protein
MEVVGGAVRTIAIVVAAFIVLSLLITFAFVYRKPEGYLVGALLVIAIAIGWLVARKPRPVSGR